jgi:hypothetical protein
VQAYVNGLPVPGDPRRLRLRRHTEIVVESGPFIPPHDAFQFPAGS